MIRVDRENKLVFVLGVHSMRVIEREFKEQTGLKTWRWREWTIVGLADDNSRGLQSGMPYQPIEGITEVGFKYKNKDVPTRTDTERKGRRKKG
jgi:hypothetical protein